jgi:protein kinase A
MTAINVSNIRRIVDGKIRFPPAMSADARDLISGLCTVEVSKRMGNIRGGARTVKSHPWFASIDWDSIAQRKTLGPIVPHLRSRDDTRNFDEYEPENQATRQPYSDDLRGKYEPSFRDF